MTSWIRRHRVLTAVAAVVAVVAAVVVVTVLTIDQPGPASVDEAVSDFDAGEQDGGRTTTFRPPAGVYRYEGEGREELSFPPLHQDDGAVIPGTVEHGDDGCFTLTVEYNAAHWQSWTWCPEGEGIAEVGGRTGQTWDLGVSSASNVSDFTCDPPNVVLPPSDTTVRHACIGTNSAISGETTSAGPYRYVGEEELQVDGEVVPTAHFRSQRRMTGAQEGRERTELWFRSDGLLVRYERDIEVRTDSPVGDITYTERGHFQLADLQVRR